MSQADLGTIPTDTTSGVDLATLLKNWRDAVHSNHSGSTAPSYIQDGMQWIDSSTDPWTMKVRKDGSDISLGSVTENVWGPILPGMTFDWAGITLPSGYLWPDGAAEDRTTYADLFGAITLLVVGDATNASAVITGVDDYTGLGLIGSKVEGTGIQANSVILSMTSSSITLDKNATATNAGITLRLFPHGNGNGTTTFNKPDLRSRVVAGRGDMGGTAANRITTAVSGFAGTVLGAAGGSESHTLISGEIPSHTHTASSSGSTGSSGNHTHSFSDSVQTSNDGGHSHSYTQQGNTSPFFPDNSVAGYVRLLDYANPTISGTTGSVGNHHHDVSVSGTTGSGGNHTHSLTLSTTINPTGGGGAHRNMQPTIIMNKILKY